MRSDPRELAEGFSLVLRDLVLLLRQVTAEQPVSAQQLGILGSLEAGPRRVTELAREHGVRAPTMTAHVSRLEEAEAVSRGVDTDDARVVTVGLTSRGRDLLAAGRAARTAFLAERLEALGESERAALAAALPVLSRICAGG
ncbi:DNA-binding transcriptional regulator, MarR family [Marinactinospora thermotolerans DSM 45154]|uniref:DNA-binding transcriptional regulator, MarR family n=1 Tax=Marinactinospora thermotolerans DSM 45154 TaxID=1122192 RepID=A0A1T4P7Z1_9ACTN|nr:MarR family transcriptional regulator [Marinactinospora thermotolerans]SJZ87695.1 DNA-binding transcriptional regulator, MarR family [Marinactinospora thermotolerans DSM 45154]